ncbi:MAG: biotin--[acetyl-CoA-carboxylase] ligase, partial [Alphaproteobacteria bacterium]|nr:biotin--[acetyl-CoA-carboxylase] ligase [Alphaproteobacteria bacterium]
MMIALMMIDWRIQWINETSSTNDDVLKAARVGEAEGLVVVAERMTAGRGRHGRPWHAPPGNLYCSVLLHPQGGFQNL